MWRMKMMMKMMNEARGLSSRAQRRKELYIERVGSKQTLSLSLECLVHWNESPQKIEAETSRFRGILLWFDGNICILHQSTRRVGAARDASVVEPTLVKKWPETRIRLLRQVGLPTGLPIHKKVPRIQRHPRETRWTVWTTQDPDFCQATA
jgi:hypothetical protein